MIRLRVPHKQQGFTLIELMVSTAIFVLLSGAIFALLAPAQMQFQNQSQIVSAFEEARLSDGSLGHGHWASPDYALGGALSTQHLVDMNRRLAEAARLPRDGHRSRATQLPAWTCRRADLLSRV